MGRDVSVWPFYLFSAATVGCCVDLRSVRRQTACAIFSDMEVDQAAYGYAVLPGAGTVTPGRVVPGHWGEGEGRLPIGKVQD